MSGSKWFKVGFGGARFKFIKYLIKLFQYKKSAPNNSNQNKLNSAEIKVNKIKRNKFGYPMYDNHESRNY